MKKISSSLFIVTLVTVFFALSSFTNPGNGSAGDKGKGNVVTPDEGWSWYWVADNCDAESVPASSSRSQTATNGFVNVTTTFHLPEGHCDIPETGATVVHYDEDSWAVINSNGTVHAKIVYKPNDN